MIKVLMVVDYRGGRVSKWQCVTEMKDEEVRCGRAKSQNISAVPSDRRQRYFVEGRGNS